MRQLCVPSIRLLLARGLGNESEKVLTSHLSFRSLNAFTNAKKGTNVNLTSSTMTLLGRPSVFFLVSNSGYYSRMVSLSKNGIGQMFFQ